MIRRLRSRHRATFVFLALALPVGLGLALTSRKSVPPGEIAAQASLGVPARDETVKLGAIELRLRLWNTGAGNSRVLELTPRRDPELPDVLVYWSASEETTGLPAQSVLLGSLAGTQSRRFALPSDVRGGRLYLYSLAHQELAASVEFER